MFQTQISINFCCWYLPAYGKGLVLSSYRVPLNTKCCGIAGICVFILTYFHLMHKLVSLKSECIKAAGVTM